MRGGNLTGSGGVILAVDIGNTHVVVGLLDGERIAGAWRIATRPEMTADELHVLLRGFLGERLPVVEGVILASVVPPLTRQVSRALRRLTGRDPIEVAPGIRTGLRIRVDNPQEVGADRIVGAVAALHRYGGPAVVVDFGTATTLDVVTAAGDYLGGVIAPGPAVGGEALSRRAARLARVDLVVPPRVIGRNTVDSLRSGLLHGHAAMVDGLVQRIEHELGERVRVIATGGWVGVLAPLLARVDAVDPDLTLSGLRLLYERNRA